MVRRKTYYYRKSKIYFRLQTVDKVIFVQRKVLGNRKRDSLPLRRIDNFKNSLKFIEIINSNLNKKLLVFALWRTRQKK